LLVEFANQKDSSVRTENIGHSLGKNTKLVVELGLPEP
jgi:hypothetical protein